ncbi:MAG: citrate synthase [Acidobacteria bacterium RIFCSPLOWO2_02_FULL_65_29]|nr:MAG: citrate synthase [Acidobacteria bacterium RIFCSPLOWO2_02_FULL_65_29]
MTTVARPKGGLEDTVATSSAICYLDGDRGVLAYCGHDIHDLAKHATFEEVCYLLWHRRLPTRAELGDLQSELVAGRRLPEAIIRLMRSLPAGSTGSGPQHGAGPGEGSAGMDALRTLASALGHYDPDASDNSPQSNYRKAVRLTAQFASLVATLGRVNAGKGPIEPDPVLGHAANFLYMLTGERPSGLATRALDVALVLHADHELNASTFAARVAAATLTDIHSAMVAAIGTLKGPLHGGANADVMRMLLDIGADATPEKAEEVVRAKLARKEKIPGFGHRVYHTEDPRATHLRQMSRDLGLRAGQPGWFEMSQRIEALVKAEKKLNANVDFYSASTYYVLGIPIDLFTPIFAVSRVSGWTAHVLEQYANNRLIRPRAEYTGPEYPQRYQALDAR